VVSVADKGLGATMPWTALKLAIQSEGRWVAVHVLLVHLSNPLPHFWGVYVREERMRDFGNTVIFDGVAILAIKFAEICCLHKLWTS
jgi:hypothetical protein